MSKININKNTAIIICIVGAIAMIAFANYSESTKQAQNKPQITAEASFEDLRTEKQKELDDLKKQDEINQLKKQDKEEEIKSLERKAKIEEIEKGLKDEQPVQAVETKNELVDPVKAVVEAVADIIKDDPTELPPDPWHEFKEFAKQNPWRGKTFPEGNHLEIAKKNMDKYENIEGCHPYLLASIHYSETGLQMTNGANGQGVFQHFSSPIRYTPNSEVTDFKDQVTRACNHIRGKVGNADLSKLDDINLIGKALALYNGCFSPSIGVYAIGDYGQPNGWDKCPYTANFLTSNTGMLQCAVDGCSRWNTRQIYGTMSFIAHLKNN